MNTAAAAVMLFAIVSTASSAEEIQVGRYSMKAAVAEPAQRDLLAVVIETDVPRALLTVGEAVQYVLRRSGYHFDDTAADAATQGLLRLNLPSVHRHLGPITLRDALAVLAGPAYELHEDSVQRTLYFTVRDAYRVTSGSPITSSPSITPTNAATPAVLPNSLPTETPASGVRHDDVRSRADDGILSGESKQGCAPCDHLHDGGEVS